MWRTVGRAGLAATRLQPRAAVAAQLANSSSSRALTQRATRASIRSSTGHCSPARFSTANPPTPPSVPSGAAPTTSSAPNALDLDFDDVSKSFAVKSEVELIRGLLVFSLCGSQLLVRNARTLLDLSERILGRTLTHWALRQSFFGHFCAGETAEEVTQVIVKLEQSGLGGILDYAAEADVAAKPTSVADTTPVVPRDRTGILSARTYDYAGEADCDANAAICRSCIEAAGAKGEGNGFAAIKLTALGKPELLEHLSKILTETKTLFVAFASDVKIGEVPSNPAASSSSSSSSSSANPNPSISVSNLISFPLFQRGLQAINIDLGEVSARRLFDRIDTDKSGSIDFLEWITFLDPKALGGLTPHPQFKGHPLPTLDQESLDKVHAMIARLESLAKLAAKRRVRLMIDAEQTYFQPAIDHLVLDLQRKYNRKSEDGAKTFPVIFNTYQCYLTDSYSRVMLDLERAKREGFVFAAKIVRGAYMVQERKRAKELKYKDPIQTNIQDTHDNYDRVVSTLLRHPDPTYVLVATHNEKTVRSVTALMSSLGIPRAGGGVFFGQLLGMCDHVSFSLGRCGYSVYKYVPYGPIHDVLPYLIRRAEENSDMLGGAGKERTLMWNELKRRIKIKIGIRA